MPAFFFGNVFFLYAYEPNTAGNGLRIRNSVIGEDVKESRGGIAHVRV